jgi:hypothetical protein
MATVLGIVLGRLRAPTRVSAALSLDEKFGLKERVTTSVTLSQGQEATPAGQALLADVALRVKDLDVPSRFPVRLSWSAGLVPVGAVILALVALFYEPATSQAVLPKGYDSTEPPANLAEIKEKMKEPAKKERPKPNTGRLKPEDLAKLENELEKIFSRSVDTKEQIRERIKEMTALEEAMKQREKQMAEQTRSLKQQMQRLEQMAQKDSDGPAKDLQKAMAEGKFDKAREELERLQKKLANNQLSAKEKEQLQKQLGDLQKKLERLAQLKDKEQQLKQANLDPKTLEREMAELKKEAGKLKDLQALAQQLGQCEKALKEGKMDGALESLSKAGDQLKSMEGQEGDLQELREQLARLLDAKDSC